MNDNWYSVRCVFQSREAKPWGPTSLRPGESLYEERVTLWKASDHEEAIRRAESEAYEFARTLEADYMGIAQSYQLPSPPRDGAEVFSLTRRSMLDAGDYLDHFFDTGDESQGELD